MVAPISVRKPAEEDFVDQHGLSSRLRGRLHVSQVEHVVHKAIQLRAFKFVAFI